MATIFQKKKKIMVPSSMSAMTLGSVPSVEMVSLGTRQSAGLFQVKAKRICGSDLKSFMSRGCSVSSGLAFGRVDRAL